MSDVKSLADRAVHALAAVDAIGATMATDHPGRHHIWNLQHAAQAILADAFARAEQLAGMARALEKP